LASILNSFSTAKGQKLSKGNLECWPSTLFGTVDLSAAFYHANRVGLAAIAGQLGAVYAIPIIFVPALMITHWIAFYLLLRPEPKVARGLAGAIVAS